MRLGSGKSTRQALPPHLFHTLRNDKLTDEARLGSFAYFIDCQFAVFYNSPPRFTIAEMNGSLPCSNTLYEAKDELEFSLAQDHKPPTHQISLYTCTKLLLGESSLKTDDPQLSCLTLFGMFLLIFGMI